MAAATGNGRFSVAAATLCVRLPKYMFPRSIPLRQVIEKRSVVLLGPRQTGKSTLLRQFAGISLYLDLLDNRTFRLLATHPEQLADLVRDTVLKHRKSTPVIIFVDEIQKLPELLNEIHRLIELDKRLRFVLTGSSARKLRKQGTNLLGGRAWKQHLYPLTVREALAHPSKSISLSQLMKYGGLPSVLLSEDPEKDLEQYVGMYLKEEIQMEALTRSLTNFSRFLETAAISNAEQLVFNSVAGDAQLPTRTVQDYFAVLEDTLVGELLPAFQGTKKRKAMAASKFYFFDIGIAHALLNRWNLKAGTPEYGKAFEHLVYRELRSASGYGAIAGRLCYWRSQSKQEVDFILDRSNDKPLAIEAKAKSHVLGKDLSGLRAFAEDFPRATKILVCEELLPRITEDNIHIVPLTNFVNSLWDGKLT